VEVEHGAGVISCYGSHSRKLDCSARHLCCRKWILLQ